VAEDVRFARMADGREVAYRVMSQGDGPVVLHTGAATFPFEFLDADPMYDRFLRTLGQVGQLVLFDKPGTGASDPFDRDRDYLDQSVDAYLAVLDAVGAPAAWVVGSSTTRGFEAAQLATNHRSRLLGAALLNPREPASVASIGPANFADRTEVGLAVVTPSRKDDPALRQWALRAKRMGTSGSDTHDFMQALLTAMRRRWAELEPIEGAPPVMLLRRRDASGMADQQWWSRIFPEAECVTIEGADHEINALDAGLIAELMAGFITGTPIVTPVERQLVAVLFTDLVDSTPAAAASGDAVWRSTLDRYEAALQRTIQRHHGTVVKHTGDGALTTFASGTQAIAAAVELRSATRDLGLEGRTGIHLGEVEQRGDDIGGIAVHLAARVMGEAGPGDIVVTSTTAESTFGGQDEFDDLGSRTLKGIDRPWQIFTVRSTAAR